MNRSRILGSTAIAASLFAGLAFSGIAHAADATAASTTSSDSSTAPGEVVVTARARAETLIQVPVSVQDFTAAKLAGDNITGLDSLQYEAGFTFNSQGSSFFGGGREFPTLVFRGMTSNYGGFSPGDTGALFVDGIYISGGAASVTLADVSQVDVLKGPQNVYFGKNTFGGAVNLITSNPTEEYHASATAGYSYRGSYDDVLKVEGAIIPGLLTGRVTGELFHQGAQYTAADGGPLGEQDTKGVTVVLYATPTPDIWLRTRFHYSHDDDSTAADAFLSGTTYGTACPGMNTPYFCHGIPNLSTLNSNAVLTGTAIQPDLITALETNNFYGSPAALLDKVPKRDDSGLTRNNLQASLQGGAKLPYDTTFKFDMGYNQQDSIDITNSAHSPYNFGFPAGNFTSALPLVSRDFDFDARLSSSESRRWRVTIGGNYFRSAYQEAYEGEYFALFDNSGPTNEKDETAAVYGSLDFDILHDLTLTGEVRYQHDRITDSPLDGLGASGNVSIAYNSTLPRVILKYHPGTNTNLYLSYSEGVQPPQLNLPYIEGDSYTQAALNALGLGGEFTKDPKIRVWEVGLKQSLFDNRVFFSVDYYNQFWDNALVENILFNNPANNCSTVPTVGVSAACPYSGGGSGAFSVSQNHIQGIEFDGTVKITPKWTGHLAGQWTDALRKSYDDQSWNASFTDGMVPSQNGKRIDLVPEWQFSLDSTYKDHLVADYDWFLHGVVNYTGSQYVEAANIAEIGGYFHVNLSAGISKGNVTFEVFCSNLFNDKNWTYAVRFPDPAFFFGEAHQGVIAGAPNPRDFGFKLSAKF